MVAFIIPEALKLLRDYVISLLVRKYKLSSLFRLILIRAPNVILNKLQQMILLPVRLTADDFTPGSTDNVAQHDNANDPYNNSLFPPDADECLLEKRKFTLLTKRCLQVICLKLFHKPVILT